MDKLAALPGNSAAAPDWNDVRYAVVLARCGSLAAAARQLGVDQTTVSRRLRVLESDMGTPLFERLKGVLTPTPAGRIVVERGQRMEQEMAALCHLVADSQSQVQGTIRITAVEGIALLAADSLAEGERSLRQLIGHEYLTVRQMATRGYLQSPFGNREEKIQELRQRLPQTEHWYITT